MLGLIFRPGFSLAVVFGAAAFLLQAQQPTLNLKVNPAEAGEKIPADFLGVSLETKGMLPDAEGKYAMFRPSNRALLTLFRTLDIGSLRIGGNTVDRPDVPIPDKRDIDELFAFAGKAHVRLIYTLRLRGWSAEKDVAPARYLLNHDSALIACIAIGNEPNVYEKTWSAYAADVAPFYKAIAAAAPGVKFCGPGTTPGRSSWAAQFAQTFGKSVPIEWITQHAYPASFGNSEADPALARRRLIGPEVMERVEANYASFAPAVRAAGLKYRIEETNSDFRMGGASGVSDSFASALWALDYLYWWAEHGAQGVNFHTGDSVAIKGGMGPCVYAVYRTAGRGYDVRPLGYAMKAFALTGRGRLLRVKGTGFPEISRYAVAGPDGDLDFTLIYKAQSDQDKPVRVALDPGAGYGPAETMLLTNPGASLAATAGVTLGGAAIANDGSWHGHWSANGDARTVELRPDTALLVRFQPAR